MKKKFTILITAALMLLSSLGWAQNEQIVASYSRANSTDTITGGEFETNLKTATAYYQDNSSQGTTYYMQIKNNEAYWTTTPSSISFSTKLGGGSTGSIEGYEVYVALLDADGNIINSSATIVTNNITTQNGSNFEVSIPATNNVYGVKLYHLKKPSYNVRYYNFSLSYVEGGGVTVHSLTFNADPTEGGTIVVGNNLTSPAEVAEEAELSISATANTGYVFSNWTVTGTGSSLDNEEAASTTFIMGTEDATLTANFTQVDTYTITYYANNGSGIKTEVDYNEGDDVIVAANTFSYTGHSFTKWNTVAGGTGADYLPGATIENISADIDLYAQWEESDETIDVLNYAFTGISGTSYSAWSGKTGASGAVYAGRSGGDHNSIQLNSSSPNGIVSTTSGGKFTKVVVTWNSSTSNNRSVQIYGKNTAYEGSADLYDNDKKGTLIGSIVKGTSTELTISNDYNYIGIKNPGSAIYMDEVKITWEADAPTSDPSITANNVNIAYNATEGSIEYTVNNPVSGGVLTATTESDWLTIGSIGQTIPFTCGANPTSAERTATVTLTYTYNTTETVTKDVTITQAAAPIVYTNIPAIFAAATTTETNVLVTFNNWVVSGVSTNGKNIFVTDNNGNGFVIYYTSDMSGTFAAGNVLSGTAVSCTLKLYNGFAELLNVNATNLTITTGGTVTTADIAMAELAGVNTGALVHYENLTCSVDNNKYYLSDGTTTLQVFNSLYAFEALENGKSYNIAGVYQQYNTTKEILPRSAADIEEVVPTEPTITVQPATVNSPFTGAEGTLTVTYENITTIVAEVKFYEADGVTEATYDWIDAEINSSNNVDYIIETNTGEARSAYLKVYALGDDSQDVYSNLVTVTQAEYVAPTYAELPFAFNSGRAAIEQTDGLYQEGLGSDYSTDNTKLKFDSTGDWLLLQFSERPGTLTFDIKNNSFSGGTFTVQTSEDGATYTDLENYTTITGTQNEEFDNLGENVRYIKWIYTNKSSGNVGLGNIALAQYTVPVPSISADDVAVAYDATSGSIMYTINNYVAGTMVATTEADWISDFTYNQVDEIGEVGFTTAANTGAERSATVTLTYTYDNSKATVTKDVTVTQAGVPAVMYTVNFTLDGGTFVPNEDFTDEIVEIAAGTYNLPSATKAGFDFTGWNDGNTTYEAGAEYTVSTDIDFTAQWTESTTATYELVTSLSDFVSGAHYYIAGKNNLNVWYAMGKQNPNNRQAEEVTVSNNTINQTDNVHEVVISSDNNGFYSIFDEDSNSSSNGYLYAAGGTSNNYLKTYSIDDYDEKGQWTISIDAETNVATITANITGTNVRNNIRFNNGSGIFSCYASGGQSAIYLFKKVDNTTSITADNVDIAYNATSGSIMYTINNYVEGTMVAATEADWISDFTYEQVDEIGTVDFTATANALYESRSATVTLTYTYEDSKATATKNVIVTQAAAPIPTYTVSFTVGEGGAFVPNEDFTEDIVEIEAGTYTLPSATKAGFEFAGWNDGNTTYEAGAEYTVSADVEFTATYTELPTYTVSFSVNGTIDDNLTVTGSSITLPTSSTLTPEGFSITGWAATNGSAEAIADPYTPTEDITLYAILRQSIPHSMVINASTANFPSSYASWDEYNLEGKNFMIKQGYINTGKLQWRSASHSSGAGTMYNSDDLGKINTIILVYDSSDSNKNFTIKAGTDANPTEGTSIDPTSDGLVYTFDLSSGNYNYFVMTNGEGAGYLQSISIDYVSDLNVNTITYIETTTTLDTDLPATTCIIVESGAVLTFNGDNNGTVDNLIIEDGGQLIHDNPVSATIQRNVTGYGRSNPSGYQFIASPVKDDLNVDETNLTTSGSYDLYIFDQSQPSKEWRNYKANEFTTIGNGVGYLYANNTNITISFGGEFKPSNSDVPVTLAYTDGNRCAGWNLVGNPFACNAYIKGATGGIEAFYRMNANGDGYDAVVGAINPTEGIFVQANAIDQYFYFTRTAPDATPGKGNLNIQVAQVVNSRDAQPTIDNAIVRFDGGNTLEKFSFSEDNAKLYIPQNGKDYAVVNADTQGEMPVNFKAAENGTYTIDFSMDNVEFGYLHLIDNKTGNDVDLLQTPSYTFEANTIDYASRFRLVFSAIGNENDSENNDFGFFDANGNLLILGIEGTATLCVMDVTGRVISNETFSGNYSKAINAKAGVYMLRLIQGNDVRTQKIVVR